MAKTPRFPLDPALICMLLLGLVAFTARSPGRANNNHKPTFINIDFPGASGTFTNKINARDEVVGFYYDSAGLQHSFLLSAGQYRTIDPPGSSGGSVAQGNRSFEESCEYLHDCWHCSCLGP